MTNTGWTDQEIGLVLETIEQYEDGLISDDELLICLKVPILKLLNHLFQ